MASPNELMHRNGKAIKEGFARLTANRDRMIERGYLSILPECVMFALASHDSEHHLHTDINDFYGWALLKDGKELKRWSNRPDNHGRIDAVVHAVPQKPWVGVIIAGMRSYYSTDYEIDILNQTRDTFVKGYWKKYFTPIGLD